MTPQQQPTAVPADMVEDLQADISATLRDLDDLVTQLWRLLDSRQRILNFLTPQARIDMDAAIRAERRDRGGRDVTFIPLTRTQVGIDETTAVIGTRYQVGTDWLNTAATLSGGTGATPAPVSITAASVEAEVAFTARHLIQRIVRALSRAGVCVIHRLPTNPSTTQLLSHLRRLTMFAGNRPLLASVLADLEAVKSAAERVVDGADRVLLDDHCPHCDRHTLVVNFQTGEITCDRDPDGHHHPCRCPDAYCDCKRTPVTHRHTWHRDRGTSADGWWALADRLNLTRTTSVT